MLVNIAVPFTRAQDLVVFFGCEGGTNRWDLALWRGGIMWAELLPEKMLIWLYGVPN